MGRVSSTGSKKRSSKIKDSFHKTFTKLSYRLHIRGVIYSQRDERGAKLLKTQRQTTGQEDKQMAKVFFGHIQYDGEYNDMSGLLTVSNALTDKTVSKHYANKYTAKRGFMRIVRHMQKVEYGTKD